jgi:hypothetical protein
MNTHKDIQLAAVKNKNQLKAFIHLPEKLHKKHTKWVPPIYADEWKYYDPKRNQAYAYCDVILVLCYYKGKLSGRIMGVINHRYNSLKNEKSARFCNFESINNQLVSNELLNYIKNWASEKGMNNLIGPLGMYYHDPIGFMIEGYDYEPSISTYYNFDYLPTLIEIAGYKKKYDLVAYKINIVNGIPDLFRQLYDRLSNSNTIELLKFKSKQDLKKMVIPMLQLLNECYTEIDGYSPLDDNEMQILAKQFIPILDPKYVKLVLVNKEPAGFMIAMPNISPGIRRSGGRLFPFGIFHILSAHKKSFQLDFLLGGIKKQYQGIGIDAFMAFDIIKTARQNNFALVDSHLEMEQNYKVRRGMEKLGGQVYKKYRLYQKNID